MTAATTHRMTRAAGAVGRDTGCLPSDVAALLSEREAAVAEAAAMTADPRHHDDAALAGACATILRHTCDPVLRARATHLAAVLTVEVAP